MSLSWDDVQDRFARLRKASSWPADLLQVESPEARRTRESLQSEAVWKKIHGAHAMVERMGGTTEMQVALTLLALKASWEVALLAGWIVRGRPLAEATCTGVSLWDRPLLDAVGRLPAGLTLDPSRCDEDLFVRALGAVGVIVRGPPLSQQAFLWGWLEDNVEAWPTPVEILQAEADLVAMACDRMHRASRRSAFRMLEGLSLSHRQADHVLCMADRPFRERGRVDRDVERGVLLGRAESMYDRARRKHDLKAEGTALKIHASLALSGDDDTDKDDGSLKAAILRVEGQAPAKPAITVQPPQLPRITRQEREEVLGEELIEPVDDLEPEEAP